MSILFYIICFLSYVQSAQMVQLVKALAGKHWDLGSNPRSPKTLLNFFSRYSHAALQARTIICFQISNAKWPTRQIQWLRLKVHHEPWSTNTRWILKVNEAAYVWAQTIATQTPSLGPIPPEFAPFYFSFIIFLFYLLFYYYYFN